MDIKKLQSTVVSALEDIKAQDIRVYDTVHLTSLFDRIAIASGTSNRQTKALAASVCDKVKEKGGTVFSVEGEDTGEWVLVDLGDMIVHIMQPTIRAYYRLEEIWGDKEVKLGAAKRTSAAKAVAAEEAAPKKSGRRPSAAPDGESAPKKRVRRKTANLAEEGAPAAKKPAAARKPAASRAKAVDAKAAGAEPAPKPARSRRAPAKAKPAESAE